MILVLIMNACQNVHFVRMFLMFAYEKNKTLLVEITTSILLVVSGKSSPYDLFMGFNGELLVHRI